MNSATQKFAILNTHNGWAEYFETEDAAMKYMERRTESVVFALVKVIAYLQREIGPLTREDVA